MAAAMRTLTEAVTGGEHPTLHNTDTTSAAKRRRADAVSGGEHPTENASRPSLGDLNAKAELEGSTSGGEHPTGPTTLPVASASDQPMAADAPAHVTGSSKEESTYDEIYADAGAFFSMWHPPEAHQIEAGVVFEGFAAIGLSASAVRNLGSGECMPPDVWLRVAGFVGSHEPVALLGRVWPRTPWTVRRHYQRCGRSCPCCRAALGEMLGSCDACWDLWQLKCVCIRLKMAVQTYGQQC
jgi:hypothetical protein